MSTPTGHHRPDLASPEPTRRPVTLALELARPRVTRAASAFMVPWLVFLKMVTDRDLRRAWLGSTGKVALLTLALGLFAVTSPWTKEYFQEDEGTGLVVEDEASDAVESTVPPDDDADPTEPGAASTHAVDELATALQRLADEQRGVDEPTTSEGRKKRVAELVAALEKLAGEPAAREVAESTEVARPGTAGRPEPTSAPRAAAPTSGEATAAAPTLPATATAAAPTLPATASAAAPTLPATASAASAGPAAADEAPQRSNRASRARSDLAAAIRKLSEKRGSKDPAGGDETRDFKSVATAIAEAAAAARAIERPEPPRTWSWPSLSALYAALAFVESVLLGLFRDHQSQLSRRLCLATGAEPEDPEETPRVRVNWPWLRKKLRRRARGFLIIGSGAIPIALLSVVPGVGHLLSQLATGAWAFYWLAVFTLGTARAAWTHDLRGEPFFIRGCEAAGQAPVIGKVSRRYGRLWARLASTVRPGCLTFETAPWEAVGLTLARSLAVLPVLNGLVRPVLPVAAQLVLAARPPAVTAAPERTALQA